MSSKNNPALRRIHADLKELAKHASKEYKAVPLDENLFDWHFVIKGPKDTDFEGGRYHGRILLPADYPFKPPAIIFLTKNGRWKVNEKICLSISSHHPETWQPIWGIRTLLEAIISFMNTPGEGALGSLDLSSEERKRLALESRKYSHPLIPKFEDATDNIDEDLEEISELDAEIVEKEAEKTGEKIESSINSAQNINAQAERSEREPDTVDNMLSKLSYGLLFTILAILYRKLLNIL